MNREENRTEVAKLCVGNRFRLLFGLPLLPEGTHASVPPTSGMAPPQDVLRMRMDATIIKTRPGGLNPAAPDISKP